MSVDEIKRLLAVGGSLKTRVLLSLGYGCGLRSSEIVRLKVKHIVYLWDCLTGVPCFPTVDVF